MPLSNRIKLPGSIFPLTIRVGYQLDILNAIVKQCQMNPFHTWGGGGGYRFFHMNKLFDSQLRQTFFDLDKFPSYSKQKISINFCQLWRCH